MAPIVDQESPLANGLLDTEFAFVFPMCAVPVEVVFGEHRILARFRRQHQRRGLLAGFWTVAIRSRRQGRESG